MRVRVCVCVFAGVLTFGLGLKQYLFVCVLLMFPKGYTIFLADMKINPYNVYKNVCVLQKLSLCLSFTKSSLL